MTGPGLDVEAFLDRLRGIASEWEAAHDELESMRVQGTSDDEIATAVADSGGGLVDLSLAPGLRPLGAARVSAAALQASARAVDEANRRRARLVSDSVGLAVSGRRDAAREVRDVRIRSGAGRGSR